MLGEAVTSSSNDMERRPGAIEELSRLAIQRGVVSMPFGLLAGWFLGRSSDAEQAATVFALYLGFGLVPAFASAVRVGRVAPGRLGMSMRASLLAGVVAGVAWGVAGALLMSAFGLVTTLDTNVLGITPLFVGTGLVAGLLGAVVGIGFGRRIS
ncbi:MAG: hypothetical protein R3C39_14535 [Dehalococcoidia bacterium]